jgi:cation transport ATPase
MDTEFRNTGGSRVGFIIGSDVKDSYGNRVGMIVGYDIKDSYGSRVGMLNGSDIKDSYGNRVGMIIGDDIKDTYGSRVGYAIGGASDVEKAAAGLLLFGLKPAATASSPSSSSSSDYSGNYSGNEDNAGYGRSLDDDPHNPLMQAAQGFASSLLSGLSPEEVAKIAAIRARVMKENESYESKRATEEYREKQRQSEQRIWEEKESERKEAWKKKRFFFYGLGGIIGVFLFAVFPSFVIEKIIEATNGKPFGVFVQFWIAIGIVFWIVIGILTRTWWIGLISGIVGFFISMGFWNFAAGGLPLPVLIPIGFIFGALIAMIVGAVRLLRAW